MVEDYFLVSPCLSFVFVLLFLLATISIFASIIIGLWEFDLSISYKTTWLAQGFTTSNKILFFNLKLKNK